MTSHSDAFRMGEFCVDPALDEISKGGVKTKLEPRMTQLLVCLAQRAGQVVSVEQLLEIVWKDVVVSSDSVYQAVASLRRILDDDAKDPKYIATVLRRGYRLIATVEPLTQTPRVAELNSAPFSKAALPYQRSKGRRRLVIGAALVVAIGAAAWVARHSGWSNHSTTQSAMTYKSIAVLPFVDMSEKKDQEYFGDGMAEEIIDLLAKIPMLRVVGRTSSFQFKGKAQDLRSIGTQLNVAYVLEGTVRKSGDRMRVTAQLIDTRNDTPRWSQTYDRDFGEVLKLQDEIATKVVRLIENDAYYSQIVSRKILRKPEAYAAYLQGRYARERFDQPGLEQAVMDFQRALDLDPEFSDAATGLANVYQNLGGFGLMPPAEAFEKSRAAAQLALKLDPDQREAHAVLSAIHTTYDWDWAAAEREFKLAAAGAPVEMQTYYLVALTLGRWDDALKAINRLIAGDPLDPDGYFFLALVQLRRGRLPEAEAAIRRTIELSPTYTFAHYELALVELQRNEADTALVEISKESGEPARLVGTALAYFRLGRKADSDAALSQYIQNYAVYNPTGAATVYAFRGESDEAFKWLDRAYDQRDTLLHGIKYRTEFDKLHDDPRYMAFLKKMNLPE
jgi:TolB-like protein/DNA-binding winged helix-turn-helix (wHTH) protein/Flp pilus assembly protein TadD